MTALDAGFVRRPGHFLNGRSGRQLVPAVRPVLVAIVGGSGAGKSWLAQRLEETLGRVALRISQDDFYLDRSHLRPAWRSRVNFDHPRAIDWAALEKALNNLRCGRPARLPRYDFKTHCRRAGERTVAPKAVVLVDGLWLLRRPSIRRLFHHRIFIRCSLRQRWARRLERDMAMRGRARADIRAQFRDSVQPMHALYVAPQERWADEILRGDFGPALVRSTAARLRAMAGKRRVSKSDL